MAAAQARSQSSIPGLVVIVLATAAILFGVAFVRKPGGAGGEQGRAILQLREQVTAQAETIEKMDSALKQLSSTASSFDFEVSSLRSSNQTLERRVKAIAGSKDVPEQGAADADVPSAAVAAVQAEAEARFDAQAEEIAELTAEIHALNDRANQLEMELAESRGAVSAPVIRPELPDPVEADEAPAVEVVEAPAAADESVAAPSDEPQEPTATEPEVAAAPMTPTEAAQAAATEHAELLAPFFGAGYEQPDGSRTAEAGPMSLTALAETGALDALTSEVPEENDALRMLTRIASNSPNDRTLWPYSRGDRTKTWYLRKDGRVDVPLAYELLVQHGAAFVELGLLAE